MTKSFVACGLVLGLCGLVQAGQIRGEYVEARTADIYTGPCFSNSEIFLTGHQAVVAWKVTEGSFDGVDLAGLGVAAAIHGTTTFSEDDLEGARSILIVDRRANPAQKAALIAMAKSLAGRRLSHVVAVKDETIALTVEPAHMTEASGAHAEHGMPQAARALFWVPGVAEILTRPFDEQDHVCGNESVAYDPLSRGVKVLPAYTLGHKFQAAGLGTTWNDPNCRSAFVGEFSL